MNRKRRAAWLLLAAGVTALDLWSKALWKYPPHSGYPHRYLEATHEEVIPGWVHIQAIWNEGGVWSLPIPESVLLLATLAAVPVLALWLLWPRRAGAWASAGKVLVLGGAAGNLYDRFAFRAVRDWIDVVLFGWHYPTFNVADAGLVVGIGLLLICSFREGKRKKAREAAA
ncbi:MAG: signal peptidase II [Planctomycetota bacterium]|jgi:signal peptidase II